MGLVDYSESEGSDVEENEVPSKVPKPTTTTSKPAFQKVVDRANPHKIRVNLSETAKESTKEKEDDAGPSAKKARVGGGGFSGFNSFLPAPKRATATIGGSGGTGARRGGLGSGINLKTGAAPGFSRESMSESSQNGEEAMEILSGDGTLGCEEKFMESHTMQENGLPDLPSSRREEKAKEEPKKQGNPMMFKPLSVARKPQKKKTMVPNYDATLARPKEASASSQPKSVQKVSLFSTESIQDHGTNGISSSGTYQPMIYGASSSVDLAAKPSHTENPYSDDSGGSNESIGQSNNFQGSQCLDTIASDLNLSASAKRQLLGRQSRNASAINIVNFDTDQEYAANELLRQAGEQVQHNPVRAIAPGKHSLKQLVNAASNQKEALEEQFASGRRNKREAGSKYGW
ncbi:MAG: hypothetical protein Q9166_005777 [cf. Caloplaca sp. 2 TL-2023]